MIPFQLLFEGRISDLYLSDNPTQVQGYKEVEREREKRERERQRDRETEKQRDKETDMF